MVELGGAGVDERGFGIDGDGLRAFTDLEGDVEGDEFGDVDFERRNLGAIEARFEVLMV